MELLQESNYYTQRANCDQLSRCQEVDVSGPLLERDTFSLILVNDHELVASGKFYSPRKQPRFRDAKECEK